MTRTVTTETCSLTECSQIGYNRRDGQPYCASHYMKLHRYGDPRYVAPPRQFADVTGQLFGLLTAVRRDPTTRRWDCRCTCGTETTVRLGDLRRGNVTTCGDRARHHRQDVITYAGAHDRVEAAKGRASQHTCVDCGRPAEEWSYDHSDAGELWEVVKDGRGHAYRVPYSLTPDHYDARCKLCHRRFDGKGGRR